nr:chloride channel protein [Pseudonocardia sediminis]
MTSARRWLVGTRPGLVGLALIIGVGAGLGAVVFRFLIFGITGLVTGRTDYSDAGRVPSTHFPELGIWFLLLAPVVGGLIYGPLVNRFAPEARGHGVPEVMFAVARNGGRIPARVAAVKALASALCIGTGGSVGREGPIVQIGSALGSSIGQWLRVPSNRLVLMVACGAAGGISATFNAPIAGVLFGLEIILRAFTAEAFGILVISSVTANVIARTIVGDDTILSLPHFALGSVSELPLYALLGLLAGLLGWVFARFLYLVEDACDAVWRGPEWLRPAVGGVLLGGLLLALPQMYGVGYPVLQEGISGGYALGFLLVLLIGKMVATSLTIGIGGSGGVFAPSLFVGGMAGTAFGIVADALFPALHLSPGAFGLVGMAAVFAGAAHAPITAVLIVFELTGDYAVILPLMAAVVLATGISHLVSHDTIYTLKLLRRGVDIDADSGTDRVLRTVTVGDLMTPAAPGPPAEPASSDPGAPVDVELRPESPVHDVLPELSARPGRTLPVRRQPDGPAVGYLSEHDVLEHLRRSSGP